MECYKQKRRVPLRHYLVGDSIVSIDHQFDDEDEEILCSQPQNPTPADSRPESSKGLDIEHCFHPKYDLKLKRIKSSIAFDRFYHF